MLAISNLTKTYQTIKKQKVQALNGINLTIEQGMFGLLGANGAGKSSLMRTIASLQQPDSGRIEYQGRNILTEPEYIRSQLGYLPQEFGVYPNVSAYELLDYLAKLKGITNSRARHQQIDELLHQVNLAEHQHKAVNKFSGGMKQRFGIAQALLGNPSIIIVDEPTAGLDPEERNRFHNLLVKISGQKIVLLSTHIVEDVSNLCPNMAIMAKGQVITSGSPQQLIDQMQGRIWQIKVDVSEVSAIEQSFQVISQRLALGEMTVQVYSDTCPGTEFTQITPDLESAYFAALHCHELTPTQKELAHV